ncbi:alpha/beta hydrolase [Pseudalkalibacillus sp. JSM 102089]|uniref:alpha/beta hydrolase n=1 Tax=Pseudalkalibacillus sp. JSM 102089 TaxID=3229856 RepID=UPI003524C8B5
MLVKSKYWIPVFQEERIIRVYLPHEYAHTDRSYPVLYMHDGQNVFEDQDAVGGSSLRLLNYLEQKKFQLIVVAIDSGAKRMEEYGLWKHGQLSEELTGKSDIVEAKGREYLEYIVKDLKPAIDATYRTLINTNFMAGISLGGLLTTYALCRYPTVFSKGAGISSAFFRNQEELEKFILESELTDRSCIYLDCGDKESGDERIDKAFLNSNDRIYQMLEEKASCVQFQLIKDGEHNYESFRTRTADLMSFFMNER